jgi:ATPase subunit of ABC transporter with duplicated ATPase domains
MKNAIKKLREFGKLAAPQGEPFFKRANSIEKRLEKIELLDKPLEKKNIPITFDMKDRSGKDVIIIKNLNIFFGDKTIFKNASFELYYGERVCIVGKNGSGKSTLIKEILNNRLNIKIGSNVIIGYIPQEILFENDNLTVLEEARKYFDGIETYLRSALCKFLFAGDNIYKKLSKLSGGEKVRLKLFCLMQKQYNLLILDEPTNHIDIDTKEILESALSEFKGTILFISHDRYFINKLAQRVVNIENNKLINHIGNYDDYNNSK